MAASNKTSLRTSGRTPPFIVIGLLLLMGVLGYNYWSLWNANADLSAELDVVRVQRKDGDLLIVEAEKRLASAKGSLAEAQENLNQEKKKVLAKDAELSSIKVELNSKQSDVEKFQNEKGQCESSLVQQKNEVDALKSEKDNVQKQLEEEKAKPVVCDLNSCKESVKSVLTVAAKLVGSDPISKALSEANFDAPTLMEGIQFPVPQAPKQQPETKKDEPQPENKGDQSKGNQAESKDGEKKNEEITTVSVDDRNSTELEVNQTSAEDIQFESDKTENATEIPNNITTENLYEEDQTRDEEKRNKEAITRKSSKTRRQKHVRKSDNDVIDIDIEEEDGKAKDNPDEDERKKKKETE